METNREQENKLRYMIREYIRSTYQVESERPWRDKPNYETFKVAGTGKWFAICMRVSRSVLGLKGGGMIDIMNVKADQDFIMLCAHMKGYQPGYHMNKQNWLTVYLDGSVPAEQIYGRIDESYRMVSDSPTARIYEAVMRIPKGRVATYGQVAAMAGNPKMARAVGNALHKNKDPEHVHCYRVVNSKGELAQEFVFGGAGVQKSLLEADGIEVIDGRVDLEKYGIRL